MLTVVEGSGLLVGEVLVGGTQSEIRRSTEAVAM